MRAQHVAETSWTRREVQTRFPHWLKCKITLSKRGLGRPPSSASALTSKRLHVGYDGRVDGIRAHLLGLAYHGTVDLWDGRVFY